MNNDFDNGELNFHYKRENRIKNAPDIVQSHYDKTDSAPKGIFKSLLATKSSRFLFGSIVLLLIMIFFVRNIDNITKPNSIQGISVDVSAFLFENTIYVTVTAKETEITELPLTVSFRGINEANEIVEMSNIYSIFDGNENFYRTTFEKYDIIRVECDISTETETITLQTNVQK